MAKRVRRVRQARRKQTNNEQSESMPSSSRPRSRQDAAEKFQQEYAYVIKDLRNILILAVIMFILLIILNLILPYLV